MNKTHSKNDKLKLVDSFKDLLIVDFFTAILRDDIPTLGNHLLIYIIVLVMRARLPGFFGVGLPRMTFHHKKRKIL